jgi:hypothetical protein
MKKLFMFLTPFMAVFYLSCTDTQKDEDFMAKDVPMRWTPMTCVVMSDFGFPEALGNKCVHDPAGGCKWPTSCKPASSSFISLAIENISGLTSEVWWSGAEVKLSGNYYVQLALWQSDPNLYEHPDSIR